jgi:hypothetical protein
LLFEPRRNQFVLLPDGQWIRVKTQSQWASIVQKELWQNDPFFGWLAMTGFEEVLGPAGRHYGFLTHAVIDGVILRVVDGRTMRLGYVLGGQEKEDSADSHAQIRRPSAAATTVGWDGRN